MARKCPVTGKGVQVGHNVSHSNIKTKRRFLPNLQSQSLLSDTLGPVRLRLSAAAIRTIEKNGGLDAYLRGTPDSRLSPEIRRLKKRILTAAARRGAAATRPARRLFAARESPVRVFGQARRRARGSQNLGRRPRPNATKEFRRSRKRSECQFSVTSVGPISPR
jgi:large subunit ribosomal protein L28